MSTEFTFLVEKCCPVCGRSTRVVKVKSRLVATQVDNDYCCHYRDFNPYLYHIWVCEHCSFAADEKVFLTSMPMSRRELMGNALVEKNVHFDFHEERDLPDGIASVKLAIFCAEVLKASLARQAGITMRLAWIYRLSGNREEEVIYLEKALKLYIRSLETERYPIDTLTDSMVMYLIGALYADLGDREKAVLYLSRLVDEKRRNPAGSEKLYRDARRLWQAVRESNKEADEEYGSAAAGRPGQGKGAKDSRDGMVKEAPAAKKAAPAKKKSAISRWFG